MAAGPTASLWKRGNPLLVCPHCGGAVACDEWRAPSEPREAVEKHRGQRIGVRIAPGAPEWAALYAVQGMERVARYNCSDCKTVIATLANDDT